LMRLARRAEVYRIMVAHVPITPFRSLSEEM